jgi:hypothetical protein
MYAASELLDRAQEVICILVRVPSILSMYLSQ